MNHNFIMYLYTWYIYLYLYLHTHKGREGKGRRRIPRDHRMSSFDDDKDNRPRQRLRFTYPDGDAILVTSSRKLNDELGAGLLLGIIERSKPADHLDTILGGDLSLPWCLHCHRRERGGNETIHAYMCARVYLYVYVLNTGKSY